MNLSRPPEFDNVVNCEWFILKQGFALYCEQRKRQQVLTVDRAET